MSDFTPLNPYDETTLPPDEADFVGPDLTREVRVARACETLLGSESFKLVMGSMKESIADAFNQTPLRDTDGLVYLRMMRKVVDDFEMLLSEAVDTGKLAATQLNEARERASEMKQRPEV